MTPTSLLSFDTAGLENSLPPGRLAHWNGELARLFPKPDELKKHTPAFEAILHTKDSDLAALADLAREIKANCDVVIVLGSRGAYLASQCFLGTRREQLLDPSPRLHFDGYHLEPSWTKQMLAHLAENPARLGLIVLSQGTPSAELIWAYEQYAGATLQRHGMEETLRRITMLSDQSGAQLTGDAVRRLSLPERVSSPHLLFTPAAFLPMYLAGVDAQQMLEGARSLLRSLEKAFSVDQPALQYALYRQILVGEMQWNEAFVVQDPSVLGLAHWWRYLFESSLQGLGGYPHPLVSAAWEDSPCHGQHYELCLAIDKVEDDLLETAAEALEARPAPRATVRLPRSDTFSLGALCAFFAVTSSLNHKLGNIPLRLDQEQAVPLRR